MAIVALSVRWAMGHYLEALVGSLSHQIPIHLFVPRQFAGDAGKAGVYRFRTGATRLRALPHLASPDGAYRLWKSIRALRPGIVHLFNGEGYPWTPFISRWAARDGIPLVVTVHDPDPHPGNAVERANKWLRSGAVKRASAIHVHSARFLDRMKQLGVAPERVHVIPHGSFAHRFTVHARDGITREPMALFFGRLTRYKGLETLVKAGLLLGGGLKVVIAGPGRLPRRLRRRIACHREVFELHNRYLPESEVAQLFQRASVCVLPYRQATQSSIPLIAAAFGVPVVASAVGAFADDVPRVNGILVPPEDPGELARAVKLALGQVPCYPAELEFDYLAEAFVSLYEGVAGG